MKRMKKKTLVYMLVLTLVVVSASGSYFNSRMPESKAEASITAAALLWLIPILAAGAGYALINFNNQNFDALQQDCQNIFNDITNYAQAIKDGRVTGTDVPAVAADDWLGASSKLTDGTLTTGIMTSMAQLFGAWAADSYDEISHTLQVVTEPMAYDDLFAPLIYGNGLPNVNSILDSGFVFYRDVVIDGVTIRDFAIPYGTPSISSIEIRDFDGYPSLYCHTSGGDYIYRYTVYRAKYVDGIWSAYYPSLGVPVMSFGREGEFVLNNVLWSATDINTYMLYGTVGGKAIDYIGNHYVGNTVATTGQYEAIDRTWANDYGVNSRDDTIDDTSVIAIPGVATIEDLLAALGNVATVDEMQAIIDKAVADAIAGSIDVPGETTDESTGETGNPVVVPGELEDYTPLLDMTTIFPFCIPFDLIRCFKLFSAEPETPEFHVDLDVGFYKHEFIISLEQFESLAVITRVLSTILFIIGLVMVTRKLIKG